ncbi:MAG: flavin reductase family protein [Ruminococcaceae bacterium]|nr:flavin reductase family protein [Oscillospiraceae bacterium]
MAFTKLVPEEIENVFRLVGKDWMLITAAGKGASGKETVNTMTASWGGMGVLWNKPVAFCFIRPQRYTYTLTEQSERFSLSFFTEAYRPALRLCGSKSGRDTDKFSETGLTPAFEDGVPYIKEARLCLLCRKLYAQDLEKTCFVDPALLANYKDGDFHRMYVVEIEKAFLQE